MTPITVLATFSPGLCKNKLIGNYFNAKKVILKPKNKDAHEIDLIIGWGRKLNTVRPRDFAHSHSIPYITLEDGFIHSMGQGRLGATSCSLVVDEVGIFYDAKNSSKLEQFIISSNLARQDLIETNRYISLIVKYGITKYNNAKRIIPDFIKQLKRPILIVDQVAGDMSIPYALANQNSFDQMVSAAIKENPNKDILIKTHPDVINGKQKGCIALEKLPRNIHLISDNLNPIYLMKHVSKVYVVSSQLGFEALLLKKQVVCFGVPFYSGWGLTDDRANKSFDVFKRRNKKVNLETIFHSAYREYSNYFHPDSGRSCKLENIIEYIKTQYETQSTLESSIFCLGFTPWKKRFMTHYLKTPDNQVLFVKSTVQAIKKGINSQSTVCLWSSKYEEEALKLVDTYNIPIWKIEDGFIRSVSLGSNYAPPASLTIDKSGLYFDPTKPSDLENLLLESSFDDTLLLRAKKLKQQLIQQAISKYNNDKQGVTDLFKNSGAKKIILVPGQVADDASILKGCIDITDNLQLLKAVRQSNPDAYLVYKPHPDVLSGNRSGDVAQTELLKICNEIIIGVSTPDCLSQVDEVHTMTSLVGFEAIIRDLKVFCYGVPFYSNWGLTVDRHPCPRRSRALTVDELVAGTLIKYPIYMNWETKNYTTPEVITNAISQQLKLKKKPSSNNHYLPLINMVVKKINLLKAMVNPKLK